MMPRLGPLIALFGCSAILISPGTATATVATDELPQELSVVTWNLEWFYDDFAADTRSDLARRKSAPSRDDWDWKRQAVARVLAELDADIVCLQEVENRNVVYRLIQDIEKDHGIRYRYAFVDGFDFGTEQDVAILYRNGLVEFSRREQSATMYDSGDYYNLSKHLIGRFQWGKGDQTCSLVIFNGHLRAMPDKAELRQRQGRLIHYWMKDLLERGENVIVTGDFNTEEDFGQETPAGEVSIIRGLIDDSPTDDLLDAHAHIPEDRRVTHINGRQYDRIFYSPALGRDEPGIADPVFVGADVRRDLVVQGEMDQDHWTDYYGLPAEERDISDHYPVIARFEIR